MNLAMIRKAAEMTMRALRRHNMTDGPDFDSQVAELLSYFAPARDDQAVKAIPGAGTEVPVWILGSSLYSAHLAAAMGRPYARIWFSGVISAIGIRTVAEMKNPNVATHSSVASTNHFVLALSRVPISVTTVPPITNHMLRVTLDMSMRTLLA